MFRGAHSPPHESMACPLFLVGLPSPGLVAFAVKFCPHTVGNILPALQPCKAWRKDLGASSGTYLLYLSALPSWALVPVCPQRYGEHILCMASSRLRGGLLHLQGWALPVHMSPRATFLGSALSSQTCWLPSGFC